MGFSTLDGIPMATRCGALDAGVLLHLLGPAGRTLSEVEDIVYQRSGMLGVPGFSADSRKLLASDRPEARQAIELFAFRVAGEIARLAATLGGVGGIVFTAGIGENQPQIRGEIGRRLTLLGLEIDPAANAENRQTISAVARRMDVSCHSFIRMAKRAVPLMAFAICHLRVEADWPTATMRSPTRPSRGFLQYRPSTAQAADCSWSARRPAPYARSPGRRRAIHRRRAGGSVVPAR